MSSREWKTVYALIRQFARQLSGQKWPPTHSDELIVAMYYWSVAHDKPMVWACDRENYNRRFSPKRLPSQSCFSRRIRSPRCQHIMEQVGMELADVKNPSGVNYVDSRPMPVGGCSKDVEARPGRVYGGKARGYRLHALVSDDKRLLNWAVTAMNEPETRSIHELIKTADSIGEVIIADAVFDASYLYDAVAKRGSTLIAAIRKDRLNSQLRRSHSSPQRIAAVMNWKHGVSQYLYKDRIMVEATFGNMSSYGGGLGPLPAWVRTHERVTRWIGAKIALYHARLKHRRAAA